MSKITSKRQVTIPKHIADEYGLDAGDEISWVAEGDAIRLVLDSASAELPAVEERLRLFDQATERQQGRQKRLISSRRGKQRVKARGWTREELYDRGVSR